MIWDKILGMKNITTLLSHILSMLLFHVPFSSHNNGEK